MRGIEKRIQYSAVAAEATGKHRTEFEAKLEDAKQAIKGVRVWRIVCGA